MPRWRAEKRADLALALRQRVPGARPRKREREAQSALSYGAAMQNDGSSEGKLLPAYGEGVVP